MEWFKGPFRFPVEHVDSEHETEKGGHKKHYKNRNNNYEPIPFGRYGGNKEMYVSVKGPLD